MRVQEYSFDFTSQGEMQFYLGTCMYVGTIYFFIVKTSLSL